MVSTLTDLVDIISVDSKVKYKLILNYLLFTIIHQASYNINLVKNNGSKNCLKQPSLYRFCKLCYSQGHEQDPFTFFLFAC